MIATRCKSPPKKPNASMATWLRRCSPNTARFGSKELEKLPARQVGKQHDAHHPNSPVPSVVFSAAEGHREELKGNLDWIQTLTCPGDVEMRSGWLASKPCVCDATMISTTCQ
jgi:hypothetical protein